MPAVERHLEQRPRLAVDSEQGFEQEPDEATFLRTWVVVVLAGAIVIARGEWQNPMQLPVRALFFLFLSALATGASWLCYYHALQIGPASKVAPIDKLGVVFAVVLAFLFLGDQPAPKTIAGAALIVAGAVVIALR